MKNINETNSGNTLGRGMGNRCRRANRSNRTSISSVFTNGTTNDQPNVFQSEMRNGGGQGCGQRRRMQNPENCGGNMRQNRRFQN